MSCGDPNDVDCRKVLDQVYEYLDSEVTADDLANIRQHLDDCSPCLREYDLETHLKALVRRSCHESAPDDLRVRIMMQITTVRVQLDS